MNLGYVVNVIEDIAERTATLNEAWSLAQRVMIVAARVDILAPLEYSEGLGDGVLTGRGTFQKFFTQAELRDWIDRTLNVLSVAAAPGIFFVFRKGEDRQRFSSSLFRRRLSAAVGRVSDQLFDSHRTLLQPLIEFYETRGRVPQPDETPDAGRIAEVFGSIARAFRVVRKATGEHSWNLIEDRRREDMLLYLAMERFGRRPKLSELPIEMRYDVKALCGTYKAACADADQLLFSAGDRAEVDRACKAAEVGKVTTDALYLHHSSLQRMPPILRALEGCAKVVIGEVEGANLIKLDRRRPKISYLSYPDFDAVAHPTLAFSVVIWLDTMVAKFYDFSGRANPPVLHRKETLVPAGYPGREKFERLTRQEDKRGLLDREGIGTLRGWQETLAAEGFKVSGHVLRRS